MEDGGIAHEEGGNEGLVGLAVAFARVFPFLQPSPHDDEGQDDADETQGVGDGTAEGGGAAAGGVAELLERLLGGTEGRRIGGRSAEHAHHVGQGQQPPGIDGQGHERTDEDDAQTEQVELRAALLEGAHEARTHLQTQNIDEEDEAETLRITQHVGVEAQATGSRQDADEEDVGHPEAHPADAHFGQSQTERTDERQDDDGLYGIGREERFLKPGNHS